MIQKKFEDAVSPVIGVMLLLVVTIVIAAVVAVFAGGVGVDVEPMPTTVLEIDGLSDSRYEKVETYSKGPDFNSAKASGDIKIQKVKKGEYDGISETYESISELYITKEGVVFGKYYVSGSKKGVAAYGDDSPEAIAAREKYLTFGTKDVKKQDRVLTLSSLHGDVLDLSKVSIKITKSLDEGGASGPYEYEMPKNTLSGTLSPSETLSITLPNANIDTTKIQSGHVVEVAVYYGEHKIAEEEKLRVTGVA